MLSENQRLPNGFTVAGDRLFTASVAGGVCVFIFLTQFTSLSVHFDRVGGAWSFFDFRFVLSVIGILTILKFIFGRMYAFFDMVFPKENLAGLIPEDQRLPNGFTAFENRVCNISLVILLLIGILVQQIVNPQSFGFGLTVMADLGVVTVLKFMIGKLRVPSLLGRLFGKKEKAAL